MSDLNKALGDISSIRRQMARSTEFRGYGPATLCATGLIAVLAAVSQALWVPGCRPHFPAYLAIWVGTAAISAPSSARRCIPARGASTPTWPTK